METETDNGGAGLCSTRNSLRPLTTEAAGKGEVLGLATHKKVSAHVEEGVR